MKKLILSLVILFSSQLLALDWYDFELGTTFKLDKEIVFAKEGITLKKGEHFQLDDIITLPISVSVFQFEVNNCPGENVSTEMIIIDPTFNAGDPSVGVQLQEGCLLEVYVELKDYFTKSLFTY